MAKALRIGLVGLGYMGHGIGHNILKRGFPLTVLAHKKREAVDDLVAKGAQELNSAQEMAMQCDVVLLCVPGSKQVSDLVRKESGIAAKENPGLIVMDCTSSEPQALLDLARDFPSITFVDAPLGRSPKEAWPGTLSVMVGADVKVLEKIQPLLKSFANTVQHAGGLGSGQTLKLVNNMISMGYAALYSEALVLAAKSGLSPSSVDELISTSRMNCEFFQTFMGWIRTGDSSSHQFSLSNADHTISDIQKLAVAQAVSSPLLDAIADVFSQAIDLGYRDANLPELPNAAALPRKVNLRPKEDEASAIYDDV